MGSPEAKALIRADNRKLSGDLAKSKKMFGRTFGGIAKGIKGSLGGAMGMVGAGGAAFGIAAIGKEKLDFEQMLVDIQVGGNLSAEAMAELRASIKDVGAANAQSKNELAGMALQLVELEGGAGLTAEKFKVLADAAFATGASLMDVAGMDLALLNSFDISSAEDVRRAIDAIATSGEDGSVTFREMASEFQGNAAQWSIFAGKGIDSAMQLSAAYQTLMKQGASASEVGTSLKAMLSLFHNRAVELKKAGIDIRDAMGNERNPFDIVADIDRSGILNDDAMAKKVLGQNQYARQALRSLIELDDKLKENLEATRKGGEIEKNIAERKLSDAFRIKKAMNDAKEAISEAFTPERIKMFASALEDGAEILVFMVDNAAAFAAIWAGIKLTSLTSSMAQMAASSAAMATSSAAAGASMSAMSKVVPLIGVGIAAWGVGTALDQWLGISDKLSEHSQAEPFEGSQGLRDRSKALSRDATARKLNGGAGFFGFDPMSDDKVIRTNNFLAEEAKADGVLRKDGTVDRKAAFLASHDYDPKSSEVWRQEKMGFPDDKTQALVTAVENSARLQKEAADLTAKGLVVEIKVDENGLLRAFARQAAEARRGTQ